MIANVNCRCWLMVRWAIGDEDVDWWAGREAEVERDATVVLTDQLDHCHRSKDEQEEPPAVVQLELPILGSIEELNDFHWQQHPQHFGLPLILVLKKKKMEP